MPRRGSGVRLSGSSSGGAAVCHRSAREELRRGGNSAHCQGQNCPCHIKPGYPNGWAWTMADYQRAAKFVLRRPNPRGTANGETPQCRVGVRERRCGSISVHDRDFNEGHRPGAIYVDPGSIRRCDSNRPPAREKSAEQRIGTGSRNNSSLFVALLVSCLVRWRSGSPSVTGRTVTRLNCETLTTVGEGNIDRDALESPGSESQGRFEA